MLVKKRISLQATVIHSVEFSILKSALQNNFDPGHGSFFGVSRAPLKTAVF